MIMSTRDVLLILGNVQEYNSEVMELLRNYRDRYEFANALRDYVEGLVYDGALAGGFNPMQSELMMTALAHVSWREVADDYYNEYHGVE